MGGYGSGRHGGRKKADHCRSIDINKMSKNGCLKTGYHGGWCWVEDGKTVAQIRLSTKTDLITLEYHFRSRNNDWEKVRQPVPVVWNPCRYGGQRPYFRCSGVINGTYCGRHAVKLYLGGKYFLCRHCYGLAYNSQSAARHDRLLKRANRRRIALGGEPGVYSPINRPKGMWQRTYQRHKFEIVNAERMATAEFMKVFSGHLTREELDMCFE